MFANEFGCPTDPRKLLRVVEVAAEKAGVEGVGVHTLRHSAAWASRRRACISRLSPACWAIVDRHHW
ncbi:MAG: hypothetical protein JOZ49_22365 [Mycolicibacterium sp.]|nr:hypothetical protein [Mycolicibacterium sp.]